MKPCKFHIKAELNNKKIDKERNTVHPIKHYFFCINKLGQTGNKARKQAR